MGRATDVTHSQNEDVLQDSVGAGGLGPDNHAALARLLDRALGQSMPPGLYIVATPIGNLGDVTIRAVAALARADHIYCEDTRITRRLLEACGLRRRLEAYHDHSGEQVRVRILAALDDGQTVALVSDAGTPLISDPGYRLVAEAAEAGHRVSAIPGASALTALLSVAGLATDTVMFLGFLPSKRSARAGRLSSLKDVDATLVLYEAPQRLAATLRDLSDVLGTDRPAVCGRELTKMHEDVRRGSLGELADWADSSPVKGEIVIAIGPPPKVLDVPDQDIVTYLRGVRDGRRLSEAARLTADALGVARQRVYKLGLALEDDTRDEP